MANKSEQNISKQMIQNIKNYNDEIKTLEGFVEGVRKNPGMYIGSIGDPGFMNMIREIVQNALDELNKEKSPCDSVRITYDERSFTTIVEDNGRGIPFNNIIRIFKEQHTSSNFEKEAGEFSSGLHGVGSKVTNALSNKFIVDSFILGEGKRVEFDNGRPWKKGEQSIPKKEAQGKQGTRVIFQPQIEVLGELSVTWKQVYDLIKLILPLNVLGAVIYFTGIDSKGKVHSYTLKNQDGIIQYLIEDTTKPLIKPIHLFKNNGVMKADIMFTYDMSEAGVTAIHAFSNFCPTASGTHLDGFYDGLGYFFSNYMNRIYLAKDTGKKKNSKAKKITVTAADTRTNLCAVIAAAHIRPIFAGQSKERLSNEEMRPFVKNMVMDALNVWSKENPTDFNKICRYLKEVAELRVKSDTEKIKLTSKYTSSPLSGLPSKYVAPIGKKDLELWICEGDSAAGTMKNCRINARQGYFPIRGKILNVFKATRQKAFENAEIAGIIAIIFDKYPGFDINKLGTKNFKIDVSKIKWSKIIFGTDADADGKHINKLLLAFFLLYMPELIAAGMIYVAKPPLYGLFTGKRDSNKKKIMHYFTERIDYVKYVQKEFSRKYQVTDSKNRLLTNAELSKLLYVNIDYTYEVNKIANRYSIDPVLLESILILRKDSAKVMERKLKKIFPFISTSTKNGIIIIEGIANERYQTIFLNNRLLDDCKDIIAIINNNRELLYKINNTPGGIYDLMNLFDRETPPNIERYKGLGEMDGTKLFQSTMNPENRTLIQYTMDNAVDELNQIRYYENNLYELVSDVKVNRFDIMD